MFVNLQDPIGNQGFPLPAKRPATHARTPSVLLVIVISPSNGFLMCLPES